MNACDGGLTKMNLNLLSRAKVRFFVDGCILQV